MGTHGVKDWGHIWGWDIHKEGTHIEEGYIWSGGVGNIRRWDIHGEGHTRRGDIQGVGEWGQIQR